ncbi:MAG: histidine kinase [Cyclobacteriaceae bacterium]
MQKIRIREIYVRWIGIFIVGFVVIAFEGEQEHLEGLSFWERYFIGVGFTAIYWTGAFWIFMMFRRLLPTIDDTFRRIVLTYLVLTVWMSIGGIPLKMALGIVEYTLEGVLLACSEYFIMNMILAGIIGTIYETVFFFEKWKETIKQNEELKNQQIRTQFEVLQNQMSPHFLFNSLNTLATLIGENQDTAMRFTEKLSEVYRYILQNKERELVRLVEELEFAQSYIYLLMMRYPDNLTVSWKVDSQYESKHIAPLTLQMLLENAIKHNVISKAHPLHIEVYVDNGECIIVKNNLQKKSAIEKSTKTGLANIEKRYEYLGNRQIEVITTAMNFMVAIPLIDLLEDKEITSVAI